MSTQADQIIRQIQQLPPAERAEVYEWVENHKGETANLRSTSRSRRGFPISKGRVPFTSADVLQIESDSKTTD